MCVWWGGGGGGNRQLDTHPLGIIGFKKRKSSNFFLLKSHMHSDKNIGHCSGEVKYHIPTFVITFCRWKIIGDNWTAFLFLGCIDCIMLKVTVTHGHLLRYSY